MQTKRLIYQNNIDDTSIKEAANLLKDGEPIAFPTETVYGLGADATNEAAVNKIYQAKGRPGDNPLIVHVASKSQLIALVKEVPDYVNKLIEAFSPGPITYVLESNHQVADNVTGGLETVGIRIPNHPAAQALLHAVELPIAAPSANLSGKPSPTTAQHVADDLEGEIPAILDGGSADVGLESTVVDCTKETPVILRLGQITKEAIEAVVGTAVVSDARQTDAPKSPGVKYKHYVPEVPLLLVGEKETAIKLIQREKAAGKKVGIMTSDWNQTELEVDKQFLLGESESKIAANLYDTLRAMKKTDVDVVIATDLKKEKVGSAVLDRLQRAATEII